MERNPISARGSNSKIASRGDAFPVFDKVADFDRRIAFDVGNYVGGIIGRIVIDDNNLVDETPSGLELREPYSDFDAFRRFDVSLGEDREPPGCRCAEVITGRCKPLDCKLFGRVCTPIYPVGPCMVSSEGSCQAYFRYRRHEMKRRNGQAAIPAQGGVA